MLLETGRKCAPAIRLLAVPSDCDQARRAETGYFPKARRELIAVDHWQADVEQREIEVALFDGTKRLETIMRDLRSVATAGRCYRASCLPLIVHERVLGSLALTIDEDLPASEGERDFLLLIARYASQAIERLNLFESERRSRAEADAAARRLRALGHASRAFAESDLDHRRDQSRGLGLGLFIVREIAAFWTALGFREYAVTLELEPIQA